MIVGLCLVQIEFIVLELPAIKLENFIFFY